MTSGHVRESLSSYIDDQMSPEERGRIARHLDACDACRQHLAALHGVVGLVRSVAPITAPDALRAQVRARVEGARRFPAGRSLPRLPVTWRTVAAAAAVVLVGVFAANLLVPQLAQFKGGIPRTSGGRLQSADNESRLGGGPASGGRAQESGAAGARQQQAAVPASPSPAPYLTLEAGSRSVIRTARLSLEVESFDAAARRLLEIAEGAGGFIADSSYASADTSPQGEFTLRVPAGQFSTVVGDVEALGTVRQQQISAQDVTEEFIDLQARRRNLERDEQQLLGFMDRATRVSDLLAIEQELSRVRGQIEQITGRLNFLAHSVDMATVVVNLYQRVKQSYAFWDLGGTLTKMEAAFMATVRQILSAAERILVLASILLPLVVVGGVAWMLLRRLVRRAGAGA